MRAGLGEERCVAELAESEVDEREEKPEEDVGAGGAEDRLGRDPLVVGDAAQGDREGRAREQPDGNEVRDAENRRRRDEEDDRRERDADGDEDPVPRLRALRRRPDR